MANQPGDRRSHAARRRLSRRGVVSVVSMMFLILFGTLAAAMAIMSRGNILTAATHLHVSRAMGAAETGLAVAAQRLEAAAGQFVVDKGQIDADFGWRLWSGTWSGTPWDVDPQPPTIYSGPAPSNGDGIAHAVAALHAMDANIIVTPATGNVDAPVVGPSPDADPAIYKTDAWVTTPIVALTPQTAARPTNTAFQVQYRPLANGTDVRVVVTGYDFDYSTRGEPVTRTVSQDFRLIKRVDAAVVSPSRIMIGKNVMVEGEIGAVYDDVEQEHGDPLVLRSDFHGLDPALDAKLDALFAALGTYDVDGDNRLRVGHPVEGAGIPGDDSEADVTGDGYVDEFDVFLSHYDANGDGMVVLSAALIAGTPAGRAGLTPEFVNADGTEIDHDLALLIDMALPDRNRNGIYSFVDSNGNGRFDVGEPLDDAEEVDPATVPSDLAAYVDTSNGTPVLYADQVLGFRDGVIDRRDLYAKVTGRLKFRTSEADWSGAQGDYRERLRGPIRPENGRNPIQFDASEQELPNINGDSFTNSETALKAAADGDGKTFARQVADNLGIELNQLETWSPDDNPDSPNAPKYYPLLPDTDGDLLPDNWETAHYEKMPFNSPNFADWYYRPVYENMTFRNVQIPEGTNALFKNCTFVGVTYVRSRLDNNHPNWTIYGKLRMSSSTGRPEPDPPRRIYGDDADEDEFPDMLSESDRPVYMAEPALDKADIPGDEVDEVIGYANLPDPLLIEGKRVIDTKPYSNNIRFHDCLFVGSVVGDAPQTYTNARNKLQFTGTTRFTERHPEQPDNPNLNPDEEDLVEIAKSSLMLPNYSVDIGAFNSPPEQDVRLKGAIVAGVLDVRGNADIVGALLLTFKPVLGEGPLVDSAGQPVGNPALFNATLGYFGPEDGDEEALDPESLPTWQGQRIVGWDLDGDGLPDLGPNETPSADDIAAGAAPVPFHGYGRVRLRFDPNMVLPDGIMLPLQVDARPGTYREGSS